MIYGVLELLGSATRPITLSKRRAQKFPLEVSCPPPGTDAVDTFQFGRSNSARNTYVFFDRSFYQEREKSSNRVSRFSFSIRGCPDTLNVTLLSTVVDDDGECKQVKHIRFKKYDEVVWKNLDSDCTLENGTIINTPGATFFWQNYRSLLALSKQLMELDVTLHKKLLDCKFISDSIFHIDFKGDFYMLEPCHHILSFASIQFWTNLGMPLYGGDNSCITKCPFCETHIEDYPGYTLVAKQPEQ